MTRVAIIVVNWNGERYLRACLGSLVVQSYPDKEIILVDNASSDSSVGLVRREFPSVQVIQNAQNLGFAAANNRGVNASQSRYVALLNNDARAEPDWLERLVQVMETDDSIGACASKMVFEQMPSMINSTGISLDRAGIAWDRLGGCSQEDDAEQTSEVFGACAGAALYRRSMFDDVGLFDEDFFAYLEDVDLAWRARLKGWRSYYVPLAKVYHVHSGTAQEGSSFKNYLLGRNKIWTVIKDYPMPEVLWFLPAILFYDLASIQYSVFVRGDWSPLKGRLAALRQLPTMLSKRRIIQQQRRVSSRELSGLLEPLVSPNEVWKRYQHLRLIRRPEEVQSVHGR